jgi:hypothetical protein
MKSRKPLFIRSRTRGAAMVEGVIVVATMLVFMGFIQYTRQAYGTKLDLQMATRANTLYFASHGCEGAADGASVGAGSGQGVGGGPAQNAANKSTVPGGQAASRSWNSASSSTQGSVNWQSVWDANNGKGNLNLTKQTGSRSISAGSKVTCNEKQYKSSWTAWAQFGMDFAMRLGGAGDLFN